MSATKKTPYALTVFPSRLGWMALATHGGAIVALSFGHRGRKAAMEAVAARVPCQQQPDPADASLVRRLQAYARGQADDFRDVRIDLTSCTPLRRRVLACCRQVGYGRTVSYGAGRPGWRPRAARAVGNCMAANPIPLIVPCHRVTLADGRLGSYSAPGGTQTKRRLLAMERAGCNSVAVPPRRGDSQ